MAAKPNPFMKFVPKVPRSAAVVKNLLPNLKPNLPTVQTSVQNQTSDVVTKPQVANKIENNDATTKSFVDDGWEDMDDFTQSFTQKKRSSLKKDELFFKENSNKTINEKSDSKKLFKKKTPLKQDKLNFGVLKNESNVNDKVSKSEPNIVENYVEQIETKSSPVSSGCESKSKEAKKKGKKGDNMFESWMYQQPVLPLLTPQLSESELKLSLKMLKSYSDDFKEKLFNWFVELPQDVFEQFPGCFGSKVSPLHIKIRDKHIKAKIKQAENLLKRKNGMNDTSNKTDSSFSTNKSPNNSFATLNDLIDLENEIKSETEDSISSQKFDANNSLDSNNFSSLMFSSSKISNSSCDTMVQDDFSDSTVNDKSTGSKFVPRTPKFTLNKHVSDSLINNNHSLANTCVDKTIFSSESLKENVYNKKFDTDSSIISISSSNETSVDSSVNSFSNFRNKMASGLFTPKTNRSEYLMEKLKQTNDGYKSVSNYFDEFSKNSGQNKRIDSDSPATSAGFSTPKDSFAAKQTPPLFTPSSNDSFASPYPPSRGGESFTSSTSISKFFGNTPKSNYQVGPETEQIISEFEEDEFIKKYEDHSNSPCKKDCSQEFKRQDYPHCKEMFRVFRHTFGLHRFRPNQMEAINAALLSNDCFILMPTGGGKSICYQLPAILTPGVTIIISPLLSLIQDQCNKLKSLDIPAMFLSGNSTTEEVNFIYRDLDNRLNGPSLKILFVTPEKISGSNKLQDTFNQLYNRNLLARFVIDEAHCVSQWGHDFRPDYKKLSTLRQTFKNVPIMALTATATVRVRKDILHQLDMKTPKWFLSSFDRPNLRYQIVPKISSTAALKEIAKIIKTRFSKMSGIVYCFSRKECEQVANSLTKDGISAACYHAGLTDNQRTKTQNNWITDRIKVVCATIAFGMGIDKADVRFVVHFTLPKSLEGYYQEAGRAGRDGEISTCILFYSFRDMHRIRSMIEGDAAGTYEAKRTHLENLMRMVHFCEDKYHCRRYLQLRYFDENYDRSQCIANKATTCDNCINKESYKLIDVTNESKVIVEGVKQISGEYSNITLLHVIDILKGSKCQKIFEKGHSKLKMYGLAQNWDKRDVNRLLHKLVLDAYLEEYFIANRDGFQSAYVRGGPKSDSLIRGLSKIVLPIMTKFQTKDDSNVEQTTSKVNPKIKEIEEKCYTALMDVVRATAESLNINTASIYTVQTVRMMSKKMPESEDEMLSIDGVTKANFEKYGKPLLEITQQHAAEKLIICIEDNESKGDQSEMDSAGDSTWLTNVNIPSSSASHYFNTNNSGGAGRGTNTKKRWKRKPTRGRGGTKRKRAATPTKKPPAKRTRGGSTSGGTQRGSASNRPGFMPNPKALHIK